MLPFCNRRQPFRFPFLEDSPFFATLLHFIFDFHFHIFVFSYPGTPGRGPPLGFKSVRLGGGGTFVLSP